MRFNYFQLFILSVCFCAGVTTTLAQQRISADDMPDNWQYTAVFDQTLPTSDTWWQQFDDPTLNSLIAAGIDNNYDVLMAYRRIEIAKQTLRQAQASYFPSFGLNGGWNKARTSGMNGPVAGQAVTGSYFDLGINMNWEIDIFGKITSRAKQSKAAFNATRAEYAATMVSICGKIATTYFQLRTIQAEIALLNEHIISQNNVVSITKARHEAGLASGLDVSQSLTTYYSTLASLTALKTSETTAINTLAVLVGQFPENMEQLLTMPQVLPDYHHIVAVGMPMELLRRRPDVVEAEYTLAGYAAALGIAKKDFLPTLSLTGSIGTSAHNGKDLFEKQSLTYAIAPTLSWTIFDGLGRKAALASAKQQMQNGIDNYNLTLLSAVQEVETAMAAYTNDLQYISYLEDVAKEAAHALQLSLDLYKQGLTAFINVTNSQITLLQYSTQLVVAQGQALSDLVTLYEALGGGWEGI